MFRMWGKVFADNHLLKDFVVENKNGNWIINAKNEDFFPSN